MDHCKSIEALKKAIDLGYSSVMYDGSALPIEENIKNTQEVVAYAHAHGVSVEGEIGSIGGAEEGVVVEKDAAMYTKPEDALHYVNETHVDALAVSIGTTHGQFKSKAKINYELLKELKYDRLYLNTPVRPPAEADVNVVSEERMRYAVETLGGISIEMMSSGAFFSEIEDDYEAVKSIIGRHPMNQFEVRGFLESRDVKDPEAMMEQMKKDEAIHVIDYKGILTFRLK